MASVASAAHRHGGDSIRFVKRTPNPASPSGFSLSKTALRKSHLEPWVRVSVKEFQTVLDRMVDPSVLIEYRWWLGKRRRFTVKWQDYHLVTHAADGDLKLPAKARVIVAEHVRYR